MNRNSNKHKFISICLTIGLILGTFQVAKAQRQISFNEGWKFQLGEYPEAASMDFDDQDWRKLDVPHDWSIEGEYSEDAPMGGQCGYLPAGIGWYRKTIRIPENWKFKHVEIAFDGVFMNSTVWANGRKLGERPYGWASFHYDISELVQANDEITFAVRVDNEKQPSARWYTGSGIYANTWIYVRDKVHIPIDGVFIKTEGNKVFVETEISNKSIKTAKGSLETTLFNSKGEVVGNVTSKMKISEGNVERIFQEFEVTNPDKWSVETPSLYKAISRVIVGKQEKDALDTSFGIRDIEWKPETGMWLNGKNVKLQGICNHQDGGALGAAIPDKILRFRINQLKEMGVNAIRTAHNPQTPQFYDMCDEMGIMVMDEIFDGWHKKAANDYGAHSFDEWWERDVEDWIRRDRNHPSIVIYSVGNETRGDIGKKLVDKCHAMDDTRPVTSGHSSSEFMDVLGVNGSSEKMGWFDEMEKDRVFIGTENTHTWQVRGYYRTKTWYRDGYPNKRQKPYDYPDLTDKEVFTYDWTQAGAKANYKQIFNSSYDNAMVRLNSRQNISQLRDIPNYAGSFRWTGHDYLGEASYVHGGWPFKSFMGGAIDMANFEKDLYYLYQSQWTEKPMVHILPHWTHPTLRKGTKIPVWVYSNCDEVELFHNGTSLGRMSPGDKWDEMQCQWMVGWEPGELKAVGYKDGVEVSSEVIKTAGSPAKIQLSVDGEPMLNEKNDIVQVRVTSTDVEGEFYPYGENRTYFTVLGSGKVRALDNGSPIDVERHYEASDRIGFFGLTRAYIQSLDQNGSITLLASSILGEKKQVSSNLVSIDVQFLEVRGESLKGEIEVFYTLDGSEPTPNGLKYEESFPVKLGTTVKAIVVLDGSQVQSLEERFDKDEGFVWDASTTAAILGGDQAEDATFGDATVSSKGNGFNGKGYLDFGRNAGGYVEWYQENDGSPGQFDLSIRYSALDKLRESYKVLLTVNGKDQELILPATVGFRKFWDVFNTKAILDTGANTIRITTLEDDGFLVDELKVE